jgi:hypothetical protein
MCVLFVEETSIKYFQKDNSFDSKLRTYIEDSSGKIIDYSPVNL